MDILEGKKRQEMKPGRNLADITMLEAIEMHLDELGVPATNEAGLHNVLARFIMLRTELADLRAENERLRRALEGIERMSDPDNTFINPLANEGQVEEIRTIARAALADPEK